MHVWIMVGIMVFVIVAQVVLWTWVVMERNRKIPDVKIFNFKEIGAAARVWADNYYRRFRERRYR